MLQKLKKQKYFYFISFLAICIFTIIAYHFPYSGDDWAWGSSLGITRLQMWFDNYNGRYLGNLLVLLLTRNKLLDACVMGTTYFLSCWLCYKYSDTKKIPALLFSITLFFFMPCNIFRQAIVWTAGYANYVPSALISLAYIVIVKNITKKEVPEYPKYMFILTFILGICGALFMETNTLFNIFLSIIVIGYTYIRFRKTYTAHFGFFIGSVLGALIMFTNSSYLTIVSGNDPYRETATGLEDTIKLAVKHTYIILDNIIIYNVFMCIIISAFIFVLAKSYIKTSENKTKNAIIIFSLLTNIGCIFAIILENICRFTSTNSSTGLFTARFVMPLIAILYIITVAITILLSVKKEQCFNLMIPFFCIPIVVAPLLVVNPMGPRCLFIAYLFMMVFLVKLFNIVTENISEKHSLSKILVCVFSLTIFIQSAGYMMIFQPIHKYEKLRNEFVYTQVENDEKTIYICNLPNEDNYVHMGTPETRMWTDRYYNFLELEENFAKKSKQKVIPYQEFEEFIKNYNK